MSGNTVSSNHTNYRFVINDVYHCGNLYHPIWAPHTPCIFAHPLSDSFVHFAIGDAYYLVIAECYAITNAHGA
ncbi:hypothetical protein FRC10_009435 [Ceratobasidium sp. 414]|nr:hypothetical protein FRC10_009435 [Ceratobasidium sp. 414]